MQSKLLTLWALSMAGAAAASAQYRFSEDFNDASPTGWSETGPANLIAEGWIFRRQSLPKGEAPSWFSDDWQSHEGAQHLESWSYLLQGPDDYYDISNWAILPPVPGQQAGDAISLFARGWTGEEYTHAIEIRYSPGGGTNTGSGPFEVGDFTELLLSIDPPQTWQLASVELPGSGRVAIRYAAEDLWTGCHYFEPCYNFGRAEIDTLTIGPPVPSNPPIPGPGETVRWNLAGSPYTIQGEPVIPPTGVVIIEPGVTVNFPSSSEVIVEGELHAQGTPQSPITFSGQSRTTTVLSQRLGGLTTLEHVNLSDGRYYATRARHCSITGGFLNGILVEDCDYIDASVSQQDQNLAVVRSTFQNGFINVLRGFLHVEDVIMDAGAISIHREESPQTVYFNDVAIRNADRAAIRIDGHTAFVGPDAIIENNQNPIEIRGGLMPGSVIPQTGNASNVIHMITPSIPTGHDIWADAGVPYLLDDVYVPGLSLTIEPGVRVIGTAGGRLWAQTFPMRLMGTPEEPIVMSGAGWDGVRWSGGDGHKAEYVNVSDGTWGFLVADSAQVPIDNCIVQRNEDGIACGNYGLAVIRKTRILDNAVGVVGTDLGGFDLNGEANPNSIAGNGVGVTDDDRTNARFNWWGDPSGPMSPQNPGGTGDSASSSIDVIPFRTTPPNFADRPPVVRMEPLYHRAETNGAIILNWTAIDDGKIVSQRVLFDNGGGGIEPIVLHEDLPPGRRSALVTVPESPFFGSGTFYVEATDDAGQIGNDLRHLRIGPDPETQPGNFQFSTQFKDLYVTGEEAELNEPLGPLYVIYLDCRNSTISLGSGVLGLDIPFSSTDTARLAAILGNGTGKVFFSEEFAIRPPAFFPDQPAEVELISPRSGSFAGGGVVPIEWTASDDEAVRSIDILGSYDGGRSWHGIASRLPGTQTRYDWRLPPLDRLIGDVRIRVIAWDERFQSSSDTSGSLTFDVGSGATPGDTNCDGAVDAFDIEPFILALTDPNGYAARFPNCSVSSADVNGDGAVDAFDIEPFIALLVGP